MENGAIARLDRAIQDIKDLNETKADHDEVNALGAQVSEVKKILLWFMGLAATTLVAGFGIVIGILVQ